MLDEVIEPAATSTTPAEPPVSIGDAALKALDMSPAPNETAGITKSLDGKINEPKAAESVDKKLADKLDANPDDGAKLVKSSEKPASKEITDEDLQMPENLRQKGQERFTKLVDGYKSEKDLRVAKEAEIEEYKSSWKALEDLGFKGEEAANDLVQFAEYRRALNSGNPDKIVGMLQEQIRKVELKYGRNVQASALEAHADLSDDVLNERLDYKRALEIAASREAVAAQTRVQEQNSQRYAQDQAFTQEREQSIAKIDQMEQQWRATNPDYVAIHPHIHAELKTIAQQFPAHMWPQQIDILYKSISRAMTSQARPNVERAMPMRGNANAAGRPVPKTTAEAALQALGMYS
jgi:hypothetical protein